MNNLQQLEEVFRESLGLDALVDIRALSYRSIEEWDSVAHMVLVAELEDVFDVLLETDEVIDLSSFENAVLILGKHGIVFDS